MAALNGRLNIVKKLLAKGAKIYVKTNDGLTSLELANNENKSEVVNFLLGYKNMYGCTLLHYAAQDNNSNLVDLFLNRGADVAAKSGNLQIAGKLIEEGADR